MGKRLIFTVLITICSALCLIGTAAAQPETLVAEDYYRRGLELRMKGDHDGAINNFTKAIELKPDRRDEFYKPFDARAAMYMLTGNWEAAIKDLTTELGFAPNDRRLYFSRAVNFESINRYAEAVEDYTKMLELGDADSDTSFDIYRRRGVAYRHLGNYALALKDLNQSIRLAPTSNFAYAERAIVYRKMGKTRRAEADERKALRIRENYRN